MGTKPRQSGVRLPEGVSAGHWTGLAGQTGCTVVPAPAGVVGGVDVRGRAPGTPGTDALRPGTVTEGRRIREPMMRSRPKPRSTGQLGVFSGVST